MSGRSLVVAERCGQLGNQLILFSHLIALAEEYGLNVYNPAFWGYADAFAGTQQAVVPTYPARRSLAAPDWLRKAAFRTTNLHARALRRGYLPPLPKCALIETLGLTPDYDKDLSTPENRAVIAANRFVYLFGWRYRSFDLFHKHAEIIRDFFRPVRHQDMVERFIAALRARYEVLIAVHVRQGDYAAHENGRFFLSTEFYGEMLKTVSGQLEGEKTVAIIFSNVQQDLSLFTGVDVVAGPGEAIADLSAMSRCDYIFGVPSTFSRWASFYGKVPLATMDRDTNFLPLADFSPSPH